MATIHIDGIPYEVDPGKNLLEACLNLGFDLPYFCWHPAMGSVGACRQCAVVKYKDENDDQGKIFMSCMEPASDGTRLSIHHPEALQFRKNIIEWLMINHPHDCPICDEGGECHLQDMTVMTGHNYRRYRFQKRTYPNQYLGPLINHEMNRCIQCYRCVRFYRDYAGGNDLDVFAAHDHVYFGRHKDGILQNEFSGNLVEVCPTGVFTDKTLKQHYTRKWDLTTAPSVCTHCSLGCNIIAGERYGGLRRVLSRYNGEVNGYFICDRGRFGYEHVNSDKRIKGPFMQSYQEKVYLDPGEVEKQINEYCANDKTIAGIGSPRASVEANGVLKDLTGSKHYYAGVSKSALKHTHKVYSILKDGGIKTPSLKEIETSDAIFILGEDLTNTAPRMALALRQAAIHKPAQSASENGIPQWHDFAVRELIQDKKCPVFMATPATTKLDDIAANTYHASAENIAKLGFAVAHMLDNSAPDPALSEKDKALAGSICNALKQADNPLIISGTSLQDGAVIDAAYNVAKALHQEHKNSLLSYILPECNSMGLTMMTDQSLDDLISSNEKIDTLVILENDLYRRVDDHKVESIINKADQVIVLDYLENRTTAQGDLVIPVGAFSETNGTFINNEGRAQRFYKVHEPFGEIRESWQWLSKFKHGFDSNIQFDELLQQLIDDHPQFSGLDQLTPPSGFRKAGQKIPRQSHRYSGRTAMHAHENVSEPKPPEDQNSPLSFTMEGSRGEPPSSLIPRFWSPGWNSAQSINKYQIEIGGQLHDGDPGMRLIEADQGKSLDYFENIPASSKSNGDELIAEPVYHIFGSETLSNSAKAISELIPKPYLGINKVDAEALGIQENETITFHLNGKSISTNARIIEGLKKGIAVVPIGLHDIPNELPDRKLNIQKNG